MFSGNTLANIFLVELLFCIFILANNFFELNFSNLVGLFVIDVAASGLDINQCEAPGEETESVGGIQSFHGTHKCHNTSKVSSVEEYQVPSQLAMPQLIQYDIYTYTIQDHILAQCTVLYIYLSIFIPTSYHLCICETQKRPAGCMYIDKVGLRKNYI